MSYYDDYDDYEENRGNFALIEIDKLPDTLKRLVEKEKAVKKIIFFSKTDCYQYSHPDCGCLITEAKDIEEYYVLTDKHVIVGNQSREYEIYSEHDVDNEWEDKDLHIHVYRNEDIRAIHLYSENVVIDIQHGDKIQEIKIPFDKRDVLDDIMLSIW